ncbi:MAG: hypothetical protein HY747_00295 [Elusimicrobia bacterium]|nr:hypothetical protein [Elusimicrobiota bacterium]
MNEERNSWIKKIFGLNGHDDEPRNVPSTGTSLQAVDKAIATALVWCAAALLMLRFRNPELGLVMGAVAVGATIAIWKKHGRN